MGKNNSKQTKKEDAFPSSPHYILEGSKFRGNVGGSAIANSYFCVPLLGKQESCESIKPRTTHPKESLIGHYDNVERRLSPADCNSPLGAPPPFCGLHLFPPIIANQDWLPPAGSSWKHIQFPSSFLLLHQLFCSCSAEDVAWLFASTECAVTHKLKRITGYHLTPINNLVISDIYRKQRESHAVLFVFMSFSVYLVQLWQLSNFSPWLIVILCNYSSCL